MNNRPELQLGTVWGSAKGCWVDIKEFRDTGEWAKEMMTRFVRDNILEGLISPDFDQYIRRALADAQRQSVHPQWKQLWGPMGLCASL